MNGVEKQIARHIARALIAKGYNISVDFERGYDCEEGNFALTDVEKIIEASDEVDECHWMLNAEREPENGACATEGYLYFIWGNGEEGRTCLSDYTTNLEPIIQHVNDWSESADLMLSGQPDGVPCPRGALETIVREMIYGEGTDASLQRVIDLCNEARDDFNIGRKEA